MGVREIWRGGLKAVRRRLGHRRDTADVRSRIERAIWALDQSLEADWPDSPTDHRLIARDELRLALGVLDD